MLHRCSAAKQWPTEGAECSGHTWYAKSTIVYRCPASHWHSDGVKDLGAWPVRQSMPALSRDCTIHMHAHNMLIQTHHDLILYFGIFHVCWHRCAALAPCGRDPILGEYFGVYQAYHITSTSGVSITHSPWPYTSHCESTADQ